MYTFRWTISFSVVYAGIVTWSFWFLICILYNILIYLKWSYFLYIYLFYYYFLNRPCWIFLVLVLYRAKEQINCILPKCCYVLRSFRSLNLNNTFFVDITCWNIWVHFMVECFRLYFITSINGVCFSFKCILC